MSLKATKSRTAAAAHNVNDGGDVNDDGGDVNDDGGDVDDDNNDDNDDES